MWIVQPWEDPKPSLCGSTLQDFGLSWRRYGEPQQTLESIVTLTLGFSLSRATRSKRALLEAILITWGVGLEPSLLPMAPCLGAGSALALGPEAPLTPPALTSEQALGGSPGNWLHPTLIFSGVKGKVINIFYL